MGNIPKQRIEFLTPGSHDWNPYSEHYALSEGSLAGWDGELAEREELRRPLLPFPAAQRALRVLQCSPANATDGLRGALRALRMCPAWHWALASMQKAHSLLSCALVRYLPSLLHCSGNCAFY